MFRNLSAARRRFALRSNRRGAKQSPSFHSRRLALESLEQRQMLSGTPVSGLDVRFHVVDDATANISFDYAANGASQGSTLLAAANAAPRGAASTIGGDKTWVIDANRTVYVYDASGGLSGSWTAGSMASNATPEGIATDGADIWIVDSKSDTVFKYAGAASRLTGSQNAASSFNLNSSNSNPKDIVTDGVALWVVDDGAKSDQVFKYSLTGSLTGSWSIDAANKAPTGISFDPANVKDIWIVDSGTDRIYQYVAAASRNSGSQGAATTLSLATANKNPQGIALAHVPWAEAAHEVSWVRQFGSAADDSGYGVATDSDGNAYLSGWTNGSLDVANPNGQTTPFLTKYDSDGNSLWLNQPTPVAGENQSGVRVAVDSQGNALQVVGAASGPSLNSYDADGVWRWSTFLPSGEQIFDVKTDDHGYAYMASYIWEGLVYLRKFETETGIEVWKRDLATGGINNTSCVSLDHLGNIYMVGYTSGSLIGPNAGLYDGFLAKYNEAGDLLWARQFGSSGIDNAFMVAADELGNVFTSGYVSALGAGDTDIFFTKFDAAGNLQWTRQLGTTGNDTGAALWTDDSGGVYFTGMSQGTLGGPNLGMVVGKYDAAGNLRWITQLGTSSSEGTSGITGDDSGNLYIAGNTAGAWDGANAGARDAVLIKLSPPIAAATDLTVTNSAVSTSTEGNLTTFDLTVTNNGPATATNVVLTDTLGANWLYNSASAGQGTVQQSGNVVTFTIGNLAAGQTVTAHVLARALEPGNLTNVATVASTTSDVNATNNSATSTVAVAAAPIVVSGPITVSGKKQNNITTATFTHAGGVHPANYYVATINWGDGTTSTGSISLSGTTYAVKGSHTYASNGSYAVTTSVARAIGGSLSSLAAAGSTMDSLGAGAALLMDADDFSAETAIESTIPVKSKRNLFVPAVRSTIVTSDDLKLSILNVLSTTQPVAPSQRAYEVGSSVGTEDTTALDAAFADLTDSRWPKFIAEIALAIC